MPVIFRDIIKCLLYGQSIIYFTSRPVQKCCAELQPPPGSAKWVSLVKKITFLGQHGASSPAAAWAACTAACLGHGDADVNSLSHCSSFNSFYFIHFYYAELSGVDVVFTVCVWWPARVWLKAPAAANNVTNNSKKAKSCCWEKCSLCHWPWMGKWLFHLYGLCGPSRREQPSSPNTIALVLVFWESNKPQDAWDERSSSRNMARSSRGSAGVRGKETGFTLPSASCEDGCSGAKLRALGAEELGRSVMIQWLFSDM